MSSVEYISFNLFPSLHSLKFLFLFSPIFHFSLRKAAQTPEGLTTGELNTEKKGNTIMEKMIFELCFCWRVKLTSFSVCFVRQGSKCLLNCAQHLYIKRCCWCVWNISGTRFEEFAYKFTIFMLCSVISNNVDGREILIWNMPHPPQTPTSDKYHVTNILKQNTELTETTLLWSLKSPYSRF